MPTIKQHHDAVRDLGCCVSHTDQGVTLHHCLGGSVISYFGYPENPGMGQRQNDWLVIPIAAKYHVGDYGIDAGMGVPSWEVLFGSQVYWLCWVNEQLDYNIFDMAGVPDPQLSVVTGMGALV